MPIPKGSVIRVKCETWLGLVSFMHYGIYAGNAQVIDMSKEEGTIKKRSITKFANGCNDLIEVIEYSKPRHNISLKHSYEIAKMLLKANKSYDLTKYNCEHFATLCRAGYGLSSQANIFGTERKLEDEEGIEISSLGLITPLACTLALVKLDKIGDWDIFNELGAYVVKKLHISEF